MGSGRPQRLPFYQVGETHPELLEFPEGWGAGLGCACAEGARSPRELLNYLVREEDANALAAEKDALMRPARGMTGSEGASTPGLRPHPDAPAGDEDRSGAECPISQRV